MVESHNDLLRYDDDLLQSADGNRCEDGDTNLMDNPQGNKRLQAIRRFPVRISVSPCVVLLMLHRVSQSIIEFHKEDFLCVPPCHLCVPLCYASHLAQRGFPLCTSCHSNETTKKHFRYSVILPYFLIAVQDNSPVLVIPFRKTP